MTDFQFRDLEIVHPVLHKQIDLLANVRGVSDLCDEQDKEYRELIISNLMDEGLASYADQKGQTLKWDSGKYKVEITKVVPKDPGAVIDYNKFFNNVIGLLPKDKLDELIAECTSYPETKEPYNRLKISVRE